ncbi:hypothetical protein KV100_14070 [Mumia sp. zg.B21]|uniref:hypothetical protein n=1 Tax=Mumia sp. zg.B21 TaxID=2855447 RepID=UPI001C6F0BB5|nr:hypothetical protein [Mumia sp. zg.B21]MBW9210782.1 hypothetical protein [Mumia sp. zg.B21]
MSATAPTLVGRLSSTDPRRGERALVGLAWAALFLNVLTFSARPILLPVPQPVGQLVTQGALPLALVLALLANRRIVVRPQLFLALLSLLAVVALMTSLHNEFLAGSVFRSIRMLGVCLVLWVLTPWWGRRDMLLLRCHRACLWFVLVVVGVGALVAPNMAFAFEGRLAGTLWPIPPTQAAHYGGVLFGTTVILWMCRRQSGRAALLALAASGAVLVATHTRTAILGVVIGCVLATATLFLGHVRVRRASVWGAAVLVVVSAVFASQLTTWAMRGQSASEAAELTGRTKVWSAVVEAPRSSFELLFGSGLSDQSFDGLPIDSNWVATYLDQGWFGVVVQVLVLLVLLLAAATRERGPERAIALFLIVYCIVASITETGLMVPSAYLLDLAVAAALLARPVRGLA